MDRQMPKAMRDVLDALVRARSRGDLIFDEDNMDTDGRIKSIYLKKRVIDFLRSSSFEIKDARSPRDWYSMLVKDEETRTWVPCNITISNGGTDNFANKHAIVYSCTNLGRHGIPCMMGYQDMFHLASNNMRGERDTSKEYYMIYLHKRKPQVIVRSLCDIKYFCSNPSNHIQIAWGKEMRFRASRSVLYETPSQFFERVRGVLASSYQGIQDRMGVVAQPLRA